MQVLKLTQTPRRAATDIHVLATAVLTDAVRCVKLALKHGEHDPDQDWLRDTNDNSLTSFNQWCDRADLHPDSVRRWLQSAGLLGES